MKTFTETLIEEIEKSDIDLDYPFYEKGERNEVETLDNVWSEAPSISINETIETLENLAGKGANRVYLYAHGDHHSYIFTGVRLEEIKEESNV